MISKSDLKKNNILGYLDDDKLEKLLPLIELNKYQEMEVIFKEDELSKNFYMLKSGKVLLEQRISDLVTVTVGSVAPNDSFGWSSIIDEGLYSTNAICSEQSEVYVVSGEAIISLLEDDHSMGYQMMKKIMDILKERLNHRTDQFIRAITAHPEINSIEQPAE